MFFSRQITTSGGRLCQALKAVVVATKGAAQNYPSVSATQEMVDRVAELSQQAAGFSTLLQRLAEISSWCFLVLTLKQTTLSTLHIYFLLSEMPYLLLHSFITPVLEWDGRKRSRILRRGVCPSPQLLSSCVFTVLVVSSERVLVCLCFSTDLCALMPGKNSFFKC